MTRVLAVSDEVDDNLLSDTGRFRGVDLIVACGDLPFDYLRYLADGLDVPLMFVPGNHDPDVSGYRHTRAGLTMRAGMPVRAPWPPGATNVDGLVIEQCGLRIAGLGGSLRYREGPNQYSQRRQAARAFRLAVRAGWPWRTGVDLLLTHAPPRGCGDADDLPHRGFDALQPLVRRLRPQFLLHGHIHPYGSDAPDRRIGNTVVRNVVGHHVLDVSPGGRVYTGPCVPSHRVPEG
jgi:3',5'-cyclic AMP phosphodiesterase CpdA